MKMAIRRNLKDCPVCGDNNYELIRLSDEDQEKFNPENKNIVMLDQDVILELLL